MGLSNNRILRGALAGAIATVPMTFVMTRLLGRRRLPPEKVTANSAAHAGVLLGDRDFETATALAHFGYGAVCGGLYGLLARHLHAKPAVKGPLYAIAIWVISYFGWIPALRLMQSPAKRPTHENVGMILSHIVWGYSLGKFYTKDSGAMITDTMAGVKGQGFTGKLAQRAFL